MFKQHAKSLIGSGITPRKILVLGDAGRGKTTFAKNLARKIDALHFSTDDFFYERKFDIVRDTKASVEKINSEVYENPELNSWVVDGTTKRLIKGGLEHADVIFLLEFKNILSQYLSIFKRHRERRREMKNGTALEPESFRDFLGMLKHVTKKRYIKSYSSHRSHLHKLIEPYAAKIYRLNNFKEIDEYLKSL